MIITLRVNDNRLAPNDDRLRRMMIGWRRMMIRCAE
jgi:hypothetical protein